MILSTGNPNVSNYKPELSTYYLTFNNYYTSSNRTKFQNNEPFKGAVHGRVTDSKTGEPLIGATIIVKGTTQGTIAGVNGEYMIDMPWDKNTLFFTYIGYVEVERYVNSGLVNVSLAPDLMELDEVVVMGYGVSSSSSFQAGASEVNVSKTKEHIPLTIEERQVSTEFEIEIPYSIASGNQPYDVTMVEYEILANYHYSAVPKLSGDAFLTAKIPDWTKYEMISGNVNLFSQGIY